MKHQVLYSERIFSKWITLILAPFTLLFLFILLFQIFIGPIGSRPAPNWFFFIMFIFFLGATVNFSYLIIKVTSTGIEVSYGVFKREHLWRNIVDCYLDDAPTIIYGGWGIRMTRFKGKWRLVFNVIGKPRVVLTLKSGRFKEFVFSANNPQQVINVVKQQINKIS